MTTTPHMTQSPMLTPLTMDTQALSKELVSHAMQDMPAMPDERLVQGRIFDTRQRLVQRLMQASMIDTQNDNISLEMEDIWREALPALMLPPIRKIAHFSAWRTAFLALLGFVLGLALGQAFTLWGSNILPALSSQTDPSLTQSITPSMHDGLSMFCGLLGAMGLVWLSEYLVASMTLGRISFLGKVYTWKRFWRMASLTFATVLVLAVVRDFMGAKIGIVHLLQAMALFLGTGQVLSFFTNIYGILLFLFLFSLLLKRPLSFDTHDFEEKLHMAIEQWWAGARLIGPLLQENIALKNDPTKDAWKKVGMELYSLAGELPEARGQWLEERLRRLGIEVTREQGKLFWSEDMTERYTALGHIAVGDACYVDEPPLMEQGLLVRKGTVRKVRS